MAPSDGKGLCVKVASAWCQDCGCRALVQITAWSSDSRGAELLWDPSGQCEVQGWDMGMAGSEQGWESKAFRAGSDAFPWDCCLCCGVCVCVC